MKKQFDWGRNLMSPYPLDIFELKRHYQKDVILIVFIQEIIHLRQKEGQN